MNINLLIDAIVQQTTVLIAQLATAAGARTSLSNTANQVFVSLVGELKQQGLGNKLIADMFGLSLPTPAPVTCPPNTGCHPIGPPSIYTNEGFVYTPAP